MKTPPASTDYFDELNGINTKKFPNRITVISKCSINVKGFFNVMLFFFLLKLPIPNPLWVISSISSLSTSA